MRSTRVYPDLSPILKMLRGRMGLVFGEARAGEAQGAVRRRMSAARETDPARYLERVSTDPELMDALIAECTVGETYFFREPEQLDVIRRVVIPEITDRRQTGTVRVWSAGCASGEEAYSLSILFRESPLADRVTVLGTDVAGPRLDRARQGRYTRWSLRGVPDGVVRRYFSGRGKLFQLDRDVRASVRFEYLNLAADDYAVSLPDLWDIDLLLCRNVLIYLDNDLLREVASRLYRALAPGGWLFLAASDPPLAGLAPFETVMTDRGIAYRRPATPPLHALRAQMERAQTEPFPDPARIADCRPSPRPEPPANEPGAGSGRPTRDAEDREPMGKAISAIRDLANRGRLAEAGMACAAALERDGRSTELLYLHSVLLSEARHHEEAAMAARRALYLQGDLAVAHLILGASQARLNDRPGASRSFRNAVQALRGLDPAEPAPCSGGEPAGRLLDLANAQLRSLGEVPG